MSLDVNGHPNVTLCQCFHTVQSNALSKELYKEKGSKFLAFAYPVESEHAIKEILIKIKKEYFDAHHHCYAWMLGAEMVRYRTFDDGEPNHSAGDPILRQLRWENLTNILVVVVRYFGGVKLGVGGLTKAYRMAAAGAIANALVIEKDVTTRYSLYYHFEAVPDVMRLVKEFDLEILNQQFDTSAAMQVLIKSKLADAFCEKVKLLEALGIDIKLSADSPIA